MGRRIDVLSAKIRRKPAQLFPGITKILIQFVN